MSILKGCLAKLAEVILLYPIHSSIQQQYLMNCNFKSAFLHLKSRKKLYKGVLFRCVHTATQRTLDICIWKLLTNNPISNNSTLNHYIGGNTSAILKLSLYPIQTAERIKQTKGDIRLNTVLRNHKKVLLNGIRYQYLINSIGYMVWWKAYEDANNQLKSWNNASKNILIGFYSGVSVDCTTHIFHVAKANIQQNKKLLLKNSFKKGFVSKLLLGGIESSIFNFVWNT